MNKIVSRLLIFFIGIPLVIAIVLMGFWNHLVMHAVIIMASAIAASEMYNIFKVKYELLPKPFIILLSAFIPLTAALVYVIPAFKPELVINTNLINYALIFDLVLVLATEVFTAKSFEKSNEKIACSMFTILYAGYLPTFIQRFSISNVTSAQNVLKDGSVALLCTFLMMVFLCDSLAWFFGVLFGKNNKGFVKASPNKSIAGFIGGVAGSVLSGIAAWFIWKEIFTGSIAKIIVVGLIISFSAIVGDLAESIFKRSSGIKDSGHIVPGRGGLLDSIDSILLSAPVFYLLINIFYPGLF